MNIHRSGSSVTLTIPVTGVTDESGKTLAPTQILYALYDESEEEILASTLLSSFATGDPSAVITIDASSNTLDSGKVNGLRVVRITTTEPDESNGHLDVRYALESSKSLALLENTYQTFEQAELLTLSMPDLIGWTFAEDRKKRAALKEAYNRLGMLRFTVEGRTIIGLNELSLDDFNALSPVFLAALRNAQLSEADIILGGDPIHSKREEGLLSDSVGESSIMFRPGKPLLMSVSRRSLNYLSGFVSFNNALGRR